MKRYLPQKPDRVGDEENSDWKDQATSCPIENIQIQTMAH